MPLSDEDTTDPMEIYSGTIDRALQIRVCLSVLVMILLLSVLGPLWIILSAAGGIPLPDPEPQEQSR